MGRSEILNYLGSGSWVSGEEMAAKLGISRAAIWKQIESLRARGWKIESSTRRGYRLIGAPSTLEEELISPGMQTKVIGRTVRCYRETVSTNEAARELARELPDGAVIIAENQTGGKGRLSRPWSSPTGGVWMSLVLKPAVPLARAYRVNMAVSVAVARALEGLYGIKAGIKWPNDLLIDDRKFCGILTEISAEVDRLEHAVVGIGINANVKPCDLRDVWNATSLSIEIGHDVSRIDLVRRVLEEIDLVYADLCSKEILSEWRSRSATLGRNVRISCFDKEIVGEAVALSDDGALVVRTTEGERKILAGDCVHLRPA